jgi:hypothetical protein
MKTHTTISPWVRSIAVVSLAALLCAVLSAGCSQAEGSRCNPFLSHDECDNAPNVQCVSPSAAACAGEAYCCTVDMSSTPGTAGAYGNITDTTEPNCQFLIACQAPTPLEGGTSGDDGGGGEAASPTPDASGQ